MSKGILKLGAIAVLGFAAAIPSVKGESTVKVAEASDGPEITGNYSLAGVGDDGVKYTGTANIKKIGGAMYKGVWSIGDNTFTGECFRDDDDLSCGWATKAKDANVVAYLVKDDGLDGVWFADGDTKLGTEYLIPTGKMKKNLEGSYKITKGKGGDGTAYNGTVVVKNMTDIGDAVFKFTWTINGAKQEGIGVRNIDAGQDDVLSVGFADVGAKEYGALQYNIIKGGKVLDGHWVQVINGTTSDGKEKMTKL